MRKINNQHWKGWIATDERYQHAIRIWSKVKSEIAGHMITSFTDDDMNGITYMIDSGARGNWGQITQLAGMKGLVANPSGRTINCRSE